MAKIISIAKANKPRFISDRQVRILLYKSGIYTGHLYNKIYPIDFDDNYDGIFLFNEVIEYIQNYHQPKFGKKERE